MSGLKWITVSRILAQALTWANTFFVIRLVSPADFGLAALAGVFANFLSLINELGFGVALIQRQTRDEETLRKVLGALLSMGAGLTLALWMLAPFIAELSKEPRVAPLIQLLALQFLVMAFSVIPYARLSMDMRFKELAIIGIGSAVFGGAVTLVFALNGAGAVGLIAGTVGLTLARAVLVNCYAPSVFKPSFRFSGLRGYVRFSGLVLLERSLWYWYMQLDSFVIGRALGAAQLGIYAVGRQLTSIPLERAMEIINSIALPTFSKIKDDMAQVRAGYYKILRLGAGYAFPVFWGLAMVSESLIRVLVGEKWLEAVPVIQILCISMPLRMLNSFTAATVTSVGRQDVNIKSLLVAIVLIPTGIVIGSRWGITGVATAWAIGFPVVYAVNAFLLKNALQLSFGQMFRSTWPPACAALMMVVALLLLDSTLPAGLHSLVRLAIDVTCGAAIFAAALLLVSRSFSRELMGFAKDFVRR